MHKIRAVKILLIGFFAMIVALDCACVVLLRDRERFNRLLNDDGRAPSSSEIGTFGSKARFLSGYRLANADRDKAEAEFELSTEDPELKAQALYNIGNIMMGRALTERKYELFERAISLYKESLRVDPNFSKAKYNLELAKKTLRVTKIIQKLLDPDLRKSRFYRKPGKNI